MAAARVYESFAEIEEVIAWAAAQGVYLAPGCSVCVDVEALRSQGEESWLRLAATMRNPEPGWPSGCVGVWQGVRLIDSNYDVVEEIEYHQRRLSELAEATARRAGAAKRLTNRYLEDKA